MAGATPSTVYSVLTANNPDFTNAVSRQVTDTVLAAPGDIGGRLYWKVASDLNPTHFSPADSLFLGIPVAIRNHPVADAGIRWTRQGGKVVFETTGLDLGGARLDLVDIQGRHRAVLPSPEPGGNTLIWNGTGRDGRELPPGIYRLRIRTADATLSEVLSIVR